jgi:threonine/homoserine/homoserine lactone efflux protein
MTWHTWLAFAAASLVMGAIPGPGVISIVGYALSSGRRVALASVAGMALGNLVAISLSLFGVGALLAASALAFSVLKWAGAAYLIGLGVLTLARGRDAFGASAGSTRPITARVAFAGNLAVGIFHPKTIIFFVAFVPQFIRADANYMRQAVVLVATFCGVVCVTDTIYALAAARLARSLRGARAAMWSRRAGGGALIAAGLATAAARQ